MALHEIRELGRGSFGRVYLADDDELGFKVAVKELLDPNVDLDRFRREAQMLADQIHNVYVVDIFRWNLNAAKPYMVLEYCEGESIKQWINKANWRNAATVLLHAANGLLGIHSVGGFHRDIKPENLLLARTQGGNYVVKLADFGLARRPSSAVLPMTGNKGGTPGYIAPELDRGVPFGTSCDIFSLGVVGIELMTGLRSASALASVDAPADFKAMLGRMASEWAILRPTAADVVIEIARIIDAANPPPQPAPAGYPPQAPPTSPVHRQAQPLPTHIPAPHHPQPRQIVPVATPAPSSGGDGLGWLFLIGGLAAAAALASGNKKEWDDNVGRYRGRDGKFKKR